MNMIVLILFISCICLLVAAIMIGRYFYHRAFDARTDKSDFIRVDPHNKLKQEDIWYLQESKYKDVSIKSKDGITLHGSCVAQNKNAAWILLVHGYMGRLEDMISYAKRYYDMGYSVLLVDLRGHGKSEGTVIGFGYLDAYDIVEWCLYLKTAKDAKHLILHGVSMGAASVMMCCDNSNLSLIAIIEDCGYASLKEQLQVIVKRMVPYVPSSFLLLCLSLVLKKKAGYRIKNANPLSHIRRSVVPILFIHGKRDEFIPISMCEKLIDACTGQYETLFVAKGRHANSALLEPDTYWGAVTSFLAKIDT